MTEPAPYTDEDVRLVAGMIRGYVLGNLPDQHCDRLARQIVAELERAGRLRHGLLVSEVMAYELGREDARRQISEGSPEDTRTEEWSFLYRDGNVDGRRYAGEAAARQYAEAFDGTPVRRWVGPWAPVPEPDPDMSTAPNSSVGAHSGAHSAHIPEARAVLVEALPDLTSAGGGLAFDARDVAEHVATELARRGFVLIHVGEAAGRDVDVATLRDTLAGEKP